MDKFKENESEYKELTKKSNRKRWLIAIVLLSMPLLMVALCVYLFTGEVSPFDSPVNPLPIYPASNVITVTNVSDIEQEIKHDGPPDGGYYYDLKSGLRYQLYVTNDSLPNITNFYEAAAGKANLILLTGYNSPMKEIFGKEVNYTFSGHYVTGYAVFSGTSYNQLVYQLVKQPTPDTKIIVLFQGLADVYTG